MVILRNQTKVKRVLIRDLNICMACGMKGSEVHHIIPLVYGGRDDEDNMVTLCRLCHEQSPDKPSEMELFIQKGGAVLPGLFGKALLEAQDKGVDPQLSVPLIRDMIRSILYMDIKYALEDYKILFKESIKIKEVNFKKLKEEHSNISSQNPNNKSNGHHETAQGSTKEVSK